MDGDNTPENEAVAHTLPQEGMLWIDIFSRIKGSQSYIDLIHVHQPTFIVSLNVKNIPPRKENEERVESQNSGGLPPEDGDIYHICSIMQNSRALLLWKEFRFTHEFIEIETVRIDDEEAKNASIIFRNRREKFLVVSSMKPARLDLKLQSVFCGKRAICSKA